MTENKILQGVTQTKGMTSEYFQIHTFWLSASTVYVWSIVYVWSTVYVWSVGLKFRLAASHSLRQPSEASEAWVTKQQIKFRIQTQSNTWLLDIYAAVPS